MSCNEALGETKAQIRENIGVAVSLSEEASHSPKLILSQSQLWEALYISSQGTCSLLYPGQRDNRTKEIPLQ